jgi:hypothetical protein
MWHPSNPGRAAVSVVSGLARLAFTSRGGTRATRAEPDAARRAELCYSMSKSFLVFDPMTGAHHALTGLRAARRAGDPSGIARGLAVVGGAVLGPAGGAFARWGERLLEQARTTAVARDDPYLRGIVGVTDAQMSIFAGRWRAALEASTAASLLLREECRGVAWERNIGQMAAIRALEELGDMHAVLTQAEELAADGVARGDRYAEVTGLLYAAIAHVARGDVASARAYAARVRSLWTLDGFHIQHFYALRVEAWCDLHAGDAERAVKRVEASWPAVRRSGLLRVPISRIDARLLRARANLALAADDRGRRAVLLGSVRRDARALARESRSDAAALASLLEAGVATIEGSKATAVDGLARAATRFDACDMALQSDHARYWHATLEGDQDASRSAAERIAFRGVSPLAPWLAVQTPGLASAR